jgi:hypothetical protein
MMYFNIKTMAIHIPSTAVNLNIGNLLIFQEALLMTIIIFAFRLASLF